MYQIDFHKPLSIHFIGIGGISMSGLAEILLEEGFTISGSDSKKMLYLFLCINCTTFRLINWLICTERHQKVRLFIFD